VERKENKLITNNFKFFFLVGVMGLLLYSCNDSISYEEKIYENHHSKDSIFLFKNGLDSIVAENFAYLLVRHGFNQKMIVLIDFYSKNTDTILGISSGFFLIPNADETRYRYLYSKKILNKIVVYRDDTTRMFGKEYINCDNFDFFDYENLNDYENFNTEKKGAGKTFVIRKRKFYEIDYNRWVTREDDYVKNIKIPTSYPSDTLGGVMGDVPD
jgi:hypothetical protein